MESSRDRILAAVRNCKVPAAELPDLRQAWIRYADPQRQFAEALASVGGQVLVATDEAEVDRQLANLPPYASARKTCSLVAGIGRSSFRLEDVTDPHTLEDVDYAILRGQFAVAENGAVWVTDANLPHRVLPFISQHVLLVVAADQIVHNMHEAYERLQFPSAGYGVFISGPSKTADIEQSLVIGAHGPRSLVVALVTG